MVAENAPTVMTVGLPAAAEGLLLTRKVCTVCHTSVILFLGPNSKPLI